MQTAHKGHIHKREYSSEIFNFTQATNFVQVNIECGLKNGRKVFASQSLFSSTLVISP